MKIQWQVTYNQIVGSPPALFFQGYTAAELENCLEESPL